MAIQIVFEKRHARAATLLFVLTVSIALVTAFGGNSPTVLGHSARELIVDNNSIVPNSIGAAEINSTSLASECSSITGHSSLCDGGDADSIGISGCSRLTGSTGSSSCTATCSSSDRLTGGACSCNNGTNGWEFQATMSTPAGNLGGAYICTCHGAGPFSCTAEAACCS